MNTIWARGAAVSLVWVLVWSLLGPPFDHHFAERQLGHSHIYLAQHDADHRHPFQDAHPHSGPGQEQTAPVGFSEGVPAGEGIVYLSSNDGTGRSIDTALSLAIKPATIFPYLGNNSLFLRKVPESNALNEAFVAPPKKPPTI